jgi:hypothetical protein
MSDKMIPFLHTLPVELVYRILDHMDDFHIFCSMENTCVRLNRIIDSYYRCEVSFFVLSHCLIDIIFKILFISTICNHDQLLK